MNFFTVKIDFSKYYWFYLPFVINDSVVTSEFGAVVVVIDTADSVEVDTVVDEVSFCARITELVKHKKASSRLCNKRCCCSIFDQINVNHSRLTITFFKICKACNLIHLY